MTGSRPWPRGWRGIMACAYGWEPARVREELERYLDYVRTTVLP